MLDSAPLNKLTSKYQFFSCYRRLTSDPYSLISLLSDMAVSEVVTVAVKIDMITRPIRTQMNANVRASTDLGARSP